MWYKDRAKKNGNEQGKSEEDGVGAAEQGAAAGKEKSRDIFHYLWHICNSSAYPPQYGDPHQQFLLSHKILARKREELERCSEIAQDKDTGRNTDSSIGSMQSLSQVRKTQLGSHVLQAVGAGCQNIWEILRPVGICNELLVVQFILWANVDAGWCRGQEIKKLKWSFLKLRVFPESLAKYYRPLVLDDHLSMQTLFKQKWKNQTTGVTFPSHPFPPPYGSQPIPVDRHFACTSGVKTHLLSDGFCLEPLVFFLIQSLHINREASGPSYHLNSSSPSLLLRAADGDRIASTPHAEGSVPATKRYSSFPFSWYLGSFGDNLWKLQLVWSKYCSSVLHFPPKLDCYQAQTQNTSPILQGGSPGKAALHSFLIRICLWIISVLLSAWKCAFQKRKKNEGLWDYENGDPNV